MRIERSRDRNSGRMVITITMLSAISSVAIAASLLWVLLP
jgi:hypothetical protein